MKYYIRTSRESYTTALLIWYVRLVSLQCPRSAYNMTYPKAVQNSQRVGVPRDRPRVIYSAVSIVITGLDENLVDNLFVLSTPRYPGWSDSVFLPPGAWAFRARIEFCGTRFSRNPRSPRDFVTLDIKCSSVSHLFSVLRLEVWIRVTQKQCYALRIEI